MDGRDLGGVLIRSSTLGSLDVRLCLSAGAVCVLSRTCLKRSSPVTHACWSQATDGKARPRRLRTRFGKNGKLCEEPRWLA